MFITRKYLLQRNLCYVSRSAQLRFSTTSRNPVGFSAHDQKSETGAGADSPQSPLPFDRTKDNQKFGHLVRDHHYKQESDLLDGKHMKKVTLSTEQPRYEVSPSPYRNLDGSFTQGTNSEEARLDPRTLEARVDSSVIRLPQEISRVINQNILSVVSPDKLRERAAQVYQTIEKEQIQKAPESSLEADAHIAALFLQNYSHAYRALSELKKRVGPSFNPASVLDIGYGPATGMIALNELMGPEYHPNTKEVYVVGRSNKEMKKRAKILLSRQLNEVPETAEPSVSVSDIGLSELRQELSNEPETNYDHEEPEDQYVGPVDVSQIQIRTRMRDALPSTKQYELIIVNQALLSREYNFPKDVDVNLHMILRLLKPDGHLVIVERGNALGFEIVARARQVMLRPESYTGERGRIPRPYIRGSSIKPQRLRKEDQIITEDHIKHEQALLDAMEQEDMEDESIVDPEDASLLKKENVDDLEAEINAKYGDVTEDDLKFEFEDSEDYEVVGVDEANKLSGHKATETIQDDVNYHLSVVAPCSHHAVCPLQLGDPKFYKISGHQHRLQFCSFNQVVERPRYTMELKRGKRLATQWNKDAEDGFGIDKLGKNVKKSLQGSGRPGGNNTESGNFSYLIMHRAKNDTQSISDIKDAREHQFEDSSALPRILETPDKVKKNVRLKVCAPSGNIEFWQIPRSVGKQDYHDARKARQGDLWALGKKSAVVKSRMTDANMDKLKRMSNMQRKFVMKEKRKQQQKKLISRQESDFDDPLDQLDALATELEQSKKYRTKGKKANFDVDLKDYEGR
ncbi:hypothetical protein JCM33374_g3306 [Metschnikowia sp. JCM 33374]|nr:hypothetical protein JCM33374_g3306 [Metschnikowia sp. JCM 33374]